MVRQLSYERHQRTLKYEGSVENVLRHWLTGEVYVAPPIQTQRRRKYRKTDRKIVTTSSESSRRIAA
jgi:hypothetical protein